MQECGLCNKRFQALTSTHLKSAHNLSIAQYKKKFPNHKAGFIVLSNLLPKDDSRFIKWKESLKKRGHSWNKGFTKKNNPSVLKISQTMQKKKIDNFINWRDKMKSLGKIKSKYPLFSKNEELAELIGLILGDGNLFKHERVERLTISFNLKYPKIIIRGQYLVEKILKKKVATDKGIKGNGKRIWIYEKNISKRLGIPCGAKKNHNLRIPEWAWGSKKLLVACLVGLFNAEGSYSIHLPTCTYNLQFSNINKTLLKDVFLALKMLKYNPHLREKRVNLRKRKETESFARLINFKYYRSWL